MKWRKGEDSNKKKKIEATSQGKQSISQHSTKTKQGNIKKYTERGDREISLSSIHIVQPTAIGKMMALR